MEMTPEDVRDIQFSKPPFGRRGYNEDGVDQFLDLVTEVIESMQDRIDELERQLAGPTPRGKDRDPELGARPQGRA